jgi:hypothetical protein
MTFLTAAVLSGAVWLAGLQADPPKDSKARAEEDKAAAEAVQKFNAALAAAGGSGDAKKDAIAQVSAVKHKKTSQALFRVLASPEVPDVRIAAADALGGFREVEGVSKPMISLLPNPSLDKQIDVRKAIIRALGELRAADALPLLHQIMDQKPFDVAREAVVSIGKIRQKVSVPLLIALLKKAEKTAESSETDPLGGVPGVPVGGFSSPGTNPNLPGGGGGGVGGNFPGVGLGGNVTNNNQREEQEERRRMLQDPINKALAAITKERWTTSKEWEIWWRKNGSTFQVEK